MIFSCPHLTETELSGSAASILNPLQGNEEGNISVGFHFLIHHKEQLCCRAVAQSRMHFYGILALGGLLKESYCPEDIPAKTFREQFEMLALFHLRV